MLLVEVWVIRTGLRMTLSFARRKPSPALNEGQRKPRSPQLSAISENQKIQFLAES
jgi:hypothetical protein